MDREKILVVDDEPFIRDILKTTLESQYDIVEACDGEEALEKIKNNKFSLLIVDYKMPRKNGIEVCRDIRKNSLCLHLPIIMLTGKSETQDKILGLEAGADDYVVKPFEPDELLARVRMILKRSARDLDANPLTRLPGNASIYNEVQKRLSKNEDFSVLYLDLNKFKAYNDYYGFQRGDSLIKLTARLIIESVDEHGDKDDFVGHIGGDDFVVVTTPEKSEELSGVIIDKFDRMAPRFYEDYDRQKGFIVTKDRQGKEQKFTILSIAVAVVLVKTGVYSHVGEIAEVGAEVKAYAKTFGKSVYIKDKRTQEA